MVKKGGFIDNLLRGDGPLHNKIDKHPIFKEKLTFGQRAADGLSRYAGSWGFILGFAIFLIIWMLVNTSWLLFGKAWDPKPFIMLNLVLSCLAAIQAPIILMSQNRQAERDRIDAKYDHAVNRKAEREIQTILKGIESIKRNTRELSKK